MMFLKVLGIFFIFATNSLVLCDKVFICYYGSWATYRSGLGKFDVSNINVDLCTHLVYSFVGIDNIGNIISLDAFLDLPDNNGRNFFGQFVALKQQNDKLKTLLAVGGWNEGSAKYSTMAANPTYRQNFIKSAVAYLQTYGFDGLDIDWEYPARRDTVHGNADIDNFSLLLKELKEEFEKHGYLLTAAVSAPGIVSSLSYNIPTICSYLDYVNLMTYDLNGAWDPYTGHNAPLHRGEGDENLSLETLLTVDNSVYYWLEQGCSSGKLVLGIPIYGRSYTLVTSSNNGVRAPTSGAGIAGPYTVTNGNLGYNEFCYILNQDSWTVKRDNLAKVPYAYQNLNWVSFDDAESVADKTKFAMDNNLAGAMVWSIETDDFHGLCNNVDYPILRAIKNVLEDHSESTNSPVSTTTTSPTSITNETEKTTVAVETTVYVTSTTESITTATSKLTTNSPDTTATTPSTGFVCKSLGYFSNPVDCESYYICVNDASGNLVPIHFKCPASLYWDQSIESCNYPNAVDCMSN